ncbi:MAG: LuxR C-terminal-related transcriptional regulator [Trebonia sp.]|jgi:LuxR family maltose regulon positive regulatory protein
MTTANPSQTGDAGLVSVPAVSGGMVVRDGLFARLGAAARVTQIAAPAGSGKTSLLRSWIGAAGLADRAAWVSVQGRDQQRFWASVAEGLRGTTVGGPLVRAAVAADLDGWAAAERLLADLGSLPDRIWLVLDDVHELNSNEALRQLELLVRHGPAELRVVLATRREAGLGLHRLRLEGELTEIRATDLRFTLEEARALLETAGVVLPEPALALLHERTEGWAAGLRLAALSLAGHPDPESFAAEFSGSERTVAEYLLAEVLERQPEEVRQLLLRTSVLEQVSGPLADALRGRSGGERILQELEQAGAFVVAVDARRSWFRYHQLFAELLQRELRCSAPGELPALHQAAAQWYAEHGHVAGAVRHAQAAQDWDLAVRSLSDHLLDLVLGGQGATVGQLLAGFPAGARTAAPELAALVASDELTRGSLEAAEQRLALAAEGSASVPADRRGRFEVVLAILRLTVASHRGDLPSVVEQAQRLLAPAKGAAAAVATEPLTGVGEDLRALTLVSLGAAELWSLHAEGAERHLELAVALARRVGRPFLEASALAHSAWAASFRSFTLAADRGTEAAELAERHGWTEDPAVAVGYLAVGTIRVWQLRLEEAARLLDQAERALRPELRPAAGLLLGQARGTLALAHGRDAQALAAFQTAEPLTGLLAAERSAHPAALLLRAQIMQVLVRLGEIGRAEQILSELGEQQREGGEIRVAMAAVHLAKDQPRAATAALAPVLGGSAPVTNAGWAIQAFLLEAIAGDALGDPAATGCALEHALDLAERDGALLAFVLNPAPELLRQHARHRATHTVLISEILSLLAPGRPPGSEVAALPKDRAGPRGSASSQLAQSLTDSEARILRYLPTNLSAPEMADQLCVSVNTVRTHMRHVYEKLGAHRRADAVDRARGLGLLASSPRRA